MRAAKTNQSELRIQKRREPQRQWEGGLLANNSRPSTKQGSNNESRFIPPEVETSESAMGRQAA